MKFKLILFFFFAQTFVWGQSFMKEIRIQKPDSTFLSPILTPFGNLQPGPNNEFSICVTNNINGFVIVNINPDSLDTHGLNVSIGEDNNWSLNYNRYENFHMISTRLSGFLLVNSKTNFAWGKEYIRGSGKLSKPYISKSNNVFIAGSYFENTVGNIFRLSKLNINDGQEEWSYNYRKSSNIDTTNYEINILDEFSNEDIFLSFEKGGRKNKGGILKLNNEGEILKQKIIKSDSILFWNQYGFDAFDNIYMTGYIINKTGSENKKDAFIAKFDSDLNLIWAKTLFAENFNFRDISISVFPNGEVVFADITIGDFPVITGKLSPNGNLIYYQGYSLFTPKVQVGKDSSIYFMSSKKYFEDGSSNFAIVIAKTNPDGSIDGCPQFDACITVNDLDISFTEWDWKRDSIVAFRDVDVQLDSTKAIMEDYCGTPIPPTPFFNTPDTICQNICLAPDSLNNKLAHGVEWTITGTNTNFQSSDTSFNFCFNEPGTYQIEQEVWLLGCSEFHTRNILVLPDSLGDLLGDDRLLCEDSMTVLIPENARPLRQFEWNDGSNEPTLNISQSGNYAITATDGFCTASDEVNLTFFKEWLVGEAFEIPKDTTVCKDLLPFIFKPTSDYTSEFFVNGSSTAQQEFSFSKEGNYQISANIEGCEIDKNFYLTVEPCEVDIYIPSSFSPNNDGINDLLEPLGKNFLGQKMEVYDRGR